MLGATERLRLKKISGIIFKASKKVRILRSLRWPSAVRLSFFKNKSQKIPLVEYEPFDSTDVVSILSKACLLYTSDAADE